ncbi:Ferrichrome-iron receptor precursor [Methyloligella halotolerans]|uniref:Ferrichrome-iron receptor n=1 Tax=Methyloligella halotolerans TaxID=1177755 RepID=A0A1E2S2I3_9HYPH|nr:TonB-dependent siderophore receptor [Methyloligella halotolerans]ODA68622.1 Ferrichrome-iron receptor precursor [Methyloligella halotolerans]
MTGSSLWRRGPLALIVVGILFAGGAAFAQEEGADTDSDIVEQEDTASDVENPDAQEEQPSLQEEEAETDRGAESSAADHELPEITVQAPYEAPAARPSPAPATTSQASAPARIESDAELQTAPSAGNVESAWGPVDGIVATRSATGMKTDTPIIEIPQSVSVISADRIEQLGANTLNEAVNYTAGVRSGIYGVDSRYDWLAIRGFDAYYPGFYFDGLFARNNNTWSTWKAEPYGAERIEILKGPSSVLYGQMNPGGTVNYVTKRPIDEEFGEAEIQAGNDQWVQGNFDMGGRVTQDGKVLYRLTGLARSHGSQVDFVDGDDFYIAPAVTYRPSDATEITVLAHYLKNDTGLSTQFLPAQGTLLPNPNGKIRRSFFGGEPNYDNYNREQWAVSYFLEHDLNETWTLRQNARYGSLDTGLNQVYGTGLDLSDPSMRRMNRAAFYSYEDVNQFVIDNQAQADFATGGIEHTLLMGVDYQNNKFDQRSGFAATTSIDMYRPDYGGFDGVDPAPFNVSDTTIEQTGLYIQDQAKMFDRLILVGGLRYDWAKINVDDQLFGADSTQHDDALSWRVGAVYEMDGGWAPYFSYSTSFLPVSGVDPLTGQFFEPETGRQYEGGLKYQPNDNLLMTFSAFDIRRQNYITSDNNFVQSQVGEIKSSGLEFEATAEVVEGLDVIAAYTWLPDFDIEQSSDPAEVGKREPIVPEHMASLWAHYQFQQGQLEGFGFGGGVRYTGETYGDIANSALMTVPSYTLFDAMVDYETEKWRFALNVQNIEDEETLSCWDTCYYGAGRTVIGSIKRRW